MLHLSEMVEQDQLHLSLPFLKFTPFSTNMLRGPNTREARYISNDNINSISAPSVLLLLAFLGTKPRCAGRSVDIPVSPQGRWLPISAKLGTTGGRVMHMYCVSELVM